MSTRTEILWIDDLDGTPADGTIHFALDGQPYEMELSGPNAKALRGSLAQYIEHARRITVNGTKRRGPVASATVKAQTRQLAAYGAARRALVRKWAIDNPRLLAAAGVPPVKERGRIAARVFSLYDERAI